MRTLLFALPAIALVPLLGGCASLSAKSKPDQPGLAIPAPPPHVVPLTPEPVVEPVAEMPAPPPAPAAARPTRGPRETPPRIAAAAEVKPDPKADPPAPETPAAPPAPIAPAPQLRTADSTEVEGAVRATIDRTRNLLNGIDYRRLSKPRQRAYDDAKRLAQQAEDALKAGNAVFAQGVATKAETFAKELSSR